MDTSQSADARESVYAPEPAAGLPPLDQARRAFEHGYLVHVLTLAAGNVTHAARYARRNRTEFYRLLRRHGLAPASFKRAAEVKRRLVP
jgi:two-component system response regulator GlrR